MSSTETALRDLESILKDSRAATIDDTVRRLCLLLDGYFQAAVAISLSGSPFGPPTCRSPLVLFRGRMTTQRPLHSRDLSYPPPSTPRPQGRCNRIGASAFYASFTIDSIPSELGLAPNQDFYLSRWSVARGMWFFVNYVGLSAAAFGRLSTSREPPSWATPQVIQEITPRNLALNEALGVAFVSSDKLDYNITNAVFEIFATGDVGALIYPTVAARGYFDNIAVRPEVVDSRFALLRVDHLLFREAAGHASLVATDWAEPALDGSLRWKGQPDSASCFKATPPIQLLINPGQWWPGKANAQTPEP